MNQLMELISLLVAMLSAIAAILAWTAKLRWSKEYRAAKNAEIESFKTTILAKDSRIADLEKFFGLFEIDKVRDFVELEKEVMELKTKKEKQQIIEEYGKIANQLANQFSKKEKASFDKFADSYADIFFVAFKLLLRLRPDDRKKMIAELVKHPENKIRLQKALDKAENYNLSPRETADLLTQAMEKATKR